MDYKEKYEKVLEKAKAFLKRWECVEEANSSLVLEEVTDIFPELAESEDERIRKELKRAITVALDYSYFDNETADNCIAWLEKQGEQKEQTLLNDNNKKYHRVPSTTLKRLYMNEAKYELLKEDITDGYIDTFVKEGSHNYLKIKIPMILCPTNCKKGDKVKLIMVKDK